MISLQEISESSKEEGGSQTFERELMLSDVVEVKLSKQVVHCMAFVVSITMLFVVFFLLQDNWTRHV